MSVVFEQDGLRVTAVTLPTPFAVGDVLLYLVVFDGMVWMVDAGIDRDEPWSRTVQSMAGIGASPGDVKAVLLTHGHVDHVGLLDRIVAASGAKVYAHKCVVRESAPQSCAGRASNSFAAKVMADCGVPGDRIAAMLAAGERFRALTEAPQAAEPVSEADRVGPFRVFHAPGHSAGDTLYVDESRRMAFVGDHLIRRVHPNPLIRPPEPGGSRPASLVQYRESLRKTRGLEVDVCLAGHGQPILDHRGEIDQLLRRQDLRAAEVRQMLRDGGTKTPYEVTCLLFPSLTQDKLFLGLSVGLGYLELIESWGWAERHVDEQGRMHFGCR